MPEQPELNFRSEALINEIKVVYCNIYVTCILLSVIISRFVAEHNDILAR